MIALPLASTVSAATTPKAINKRPRRPRRYHDMPAFIAKLQITTAKNSAASSGALPGARGLLCLRSGLLEPVDRLEAAVRLNHGQEHFIGAAVAGGAVGELEAAEIEAAGFLHGVDHGLAGEVAINLLERCGNRTADEVTLERNEAGLRVGRAGLERSMIAPDHRDRGILRERNDLRDHDAGAGSAEFLCKR